MSDMLFVQTTGAALPRLEGFTEVHPLLALEPAGERALLLIDGQAIIPASIPTDMTANTGRLKNDTGPATEPYGALMLVAFNVPVDRQVDVDTWYDAEHIPLLMRADGWLRVRRFASQTVSGAPWTSLAFHELRNPDIMNAPERHFARSTAWRAEFEAEQWFKDAGRWLFSRA